MEFAQDAFLTAIKAINQIEAGSLPQLVTGIDDSARAVMLAQLFQARPRPLLIVEPIASKLGQLVDDLTQLLPQVPVQAFVVEEALAIEFAFASEDQMRDRIQILNQLAHGEPCIVVTNVAGLRKQLTHPNQWRQAQHTLELGDNWERRQLESVLTAWGYHRASLVEQRGEFSVRGSIIDFFPVSAEYPIRLDFFDTELDSIRAFNAETQSSIENLDSVQILPAQDVLFGLEAQQALLPRLEDMKARALKKVKDQELREAMEAGLSNQLDQLRHGEPLKYPHAYLSLAQDDQVVTILDYLGEQGLLVLSEFDKLQQQAFHLVEEDQFWIEQETQKGLLIPGLAVKADFQSCVRAYSGALLYLSVMHRGLGHQSLGAVHSFQYRTLNPFFNQMPLVKTEMDHWLKQGYTIQVAVGSLEQARKVEALFEEFHIGPSVVTEGQAQAKVINIGVGALSNGFELPVLKWVVVTEKELFNKLKKRQARQSRAKLTNAERIKSYSELEVGDYVVHVHHGIGQFRGMDTIEMNGIHKDLLSVVYQDDSRILIPVDQIHLLQKYVASEAKTPKLNKLGGTEWAKTKRKVAAKIEDIADELIALYAKREREVGYAFGPDTPEQSEFELAFAYVETEDQLRSAIEIKADMEKSKPMDRLLVGDVGYGKTEVAMRAIFKAVMDGKQVAFLVPTTILAQQHYNSLVQRFADYPFEIRLMSRFVSKKQQDQTIDDLLTGAVNIVVGTHRLVSKDVQFQDLGLLIVDEEQRFGVKHKERLKQLKSQVDVLTLTATPIPRTLHMSMIGVRDLSLIETPPNNRFPVQTYVMERNDGAIKSGIERELAREGQVFYLYNRVATIERRAMEIQALVPEARVAYAHGQMSEVELETVLVDFIQGAYDVLVTTTIIETGVDIPNVNTLFVEDADHMGLSTLYQLRGRVGRTNRVAYAYLMYEPFKSLSEVSEKRLQAVREFTELGSGFKIAMRDLSIRGAGNLLGKQQSGFIDSVGFDLYSQMLKEAVDIKRGKKVGQIASQASNQIEWHLLIDAYIPASYIADERQKISVYKQIQQIDSEEAYRNLQDQLIDRYGEFPDEVADLLEIALIKHYGLEAGIVKIQQTPRHVKVSFNQVASEQLRGAKLFEALAGISQKSTVSQEGSRQVISLDILEQPSYVWLGALKQLARQVASLLLDDTSKNKEK